MIDDKEEIREESDQMGVEEFLQVTVDFDAWSKKWLQGCLTLGQIDADSLALLLRASFEKQIPDEFVTIEHCSPAEKAE